MHLHLVSDARVLVVQSLVKGVFCAGADLKVSEAMINVYGDIL